MPYSPVARQLMPRQFMAIMSTYSSELIAVSSIVSYDIYKTYINPAATGKQLMHINYIGMVAFALFMAGFSTLLNHIGISMGYLYLMMGVIISSAVLPATLTLLWSGQSWAAATFAPILGFVSAVTAWLVRTKIVFGELSVDATGSNDPMLIGNLVSLLAPVVFIPILTYLPPFKPQNYDWESMRNIRKVDDHDIAGAAHMDLEGVPGGQTHAQQDEELEQTKLAKAAKIARWLTLFLTLALLVVWPMPMFGSGYIFSKKVRASPPRPSSTRWLTMVCCSSSPGGSPWASSGCLRRRSSASSCPCSSPDRPLRARRAWPSRTSWAFGEGGVPRPPRASTPLPSRRRATSCPKRLPSSPSDVGACCLHV